MFTTAKNPSDSILYNFFLGNTILQYGAGMFLTNQFFIPAGFLSCKFSGFCSLEMTQRTASRFYIYPWNDENQGQKVEHGMEATLKVDGSWVKCDKACDKKSDKTYFIIKKRRGIGFIEAGDKIRLIQGNEALGYRMKRGMSLYIGMMESGRIIKTTWTVKLGKAKLQICLFFFSLKIMQNENLCVIFFAFH